MDVPWQCPRCSLHNISQQCAACGGPRPPVAPHVDEIEPFLGDGSSRQASSGSSGAPTQRPRTSSGNLRTWPAQGRAAQRATSPESFLNQPTFNPAELPQEIPGVGQQQPVTQETNRNTLFRALTGAPLSQESMQQLSAFLSFSGYCVPFLILMFVLFLFRHLFGMFVFLSTWNSYNALSTKIREETDRKDTPPRKAVLIMLGLLSLACGAMMVAFCWNDGLHGMYTFDLTLLFTQAAVSQGVITPESAAGVRQKPEPVFSSPFTAKPQGLSSLSRAELEQAISLWMVLWLVAMNHLVVNFVLTGIRGILFALDCSAISRHSVSGGSDSMVPTHVARHIKIKKRLCAFLDSVGAIIKAAAVTPVWMCFYEVYGEGSLDFTAYSQFVLVYLIIKVGLLVLQCRSLTKQARGVCKDDLGYGRPVTSADIAESANHNCSICLAALEDGVVLPCDHMFCRGCIEEWLDRERTCPNCRREVPGAGDSSTASTSSVLLSIF